MRESPFVSSLRERAARRQARIAFPEADDPRVQAAVTALHRQGIVRPVVVLDPRSGRSPTGLPEGITVIDPASDVRRERLRDDLLRARGGRGLTTAEAEQRSLDPLLFADDLVRHGEVDGCVAGCASTTADVIRAALWLIGRVPGVDTVSSAFYMVMSGFRGGVEEVLTFTDCAVVPQPTAEQLADITVAAVSDRRRIVGDEPVVAFLSFSTHGSATAASVERVRAAVRLTRQRLPDVAIDGELQADAALVVDVGRRKAPGSDVAGRANVLVFPDLDAGNIAYKLVERLAGATAIGPILQGLAQPCNDLSRGASADDIMNTAAVTVLQGTPSPKN